VKKLVNIVKFHLHNRLNTLSQTDLKGIGSRLPVPTARSKRLFRGDARWQTDRQYRYEREWRCSPILSEEELLNITINSRQLILGMPARLRG